MFLLYAFIIAISLWSGNLLLDDLVNCFADGVVHVERIRLLTLLGFTNFMAYGIFFYHTFEYLRKEELKVGGIAIPFQMRRWRYIHLLNFWLCVTMGTAGASRLIQFVEHHDSLFNFFGALLIVGGAGLFWFYWSCVETRVREFKQGKIDESSNFEDQ